MARDPTGASVVDRDNDSPWINRDVIRGRLGLAVTDPMDPVDRLLTFTTVSKEAPREWLGKLSVARKRMDRRATVRDEAPDF